MKIIQFASPGITEDDIQAVNKVLRSNWITTGQVNQEFIKKLKLITHADHMSLTNSATAGLFLALKVMGIGKGDEVITSPYTFAATANSITHTGAKVVFADVKKNSFYIDLEEIYKKITTKTKAIIPIDFSTAGDFNFDFSLLKKQFTPNNEFQEQLNRPLILMDSAHAIGSRKIDSLIDMAVYSFHAVKNITTGEGGALAIRSFGDDIIDQEFQSMMQLYILHGQDKSAREKFEQSSWEYDIKFPGYKYNMTDIVAALGLSQLNRYESIILPYRRKLTQYYVELLKDDSNMIIDEDKIFHQIMDSSCHLFPLRIRNYTESQRNRLINFCKEYGINTNVHYKPLTMMTANKYYDESKMPNSYLQYQNEITLPLHMDMSLQDIEYIVDIMKKGISYEYSH